MKFFHTAIEDSSTNMKEFFVLLLLFGSHGIINGQNLALDGLSDLLSSHGIQLTGTITAAQTQALNSTITTIESSIPDSENKTEILGTIIESFGLGNQTTAAELLNALNVFAGEG